MITLIGSGNVATWMAQRLQGSSRFPITQVYSRTLANARVLADLCGAEAIDNIKELNPDNQVFVFALADKAYDEILPQLPFKLPMAFMTSGTVSCQCLKDYADCYGVIYPLQTFSKSQDMSGLDVPICLESDFVGKQKPIMWELAQELSVSQMPPAEAQTGPAVRGDENVMRKQMESLEDERLREIYRMMSEIIMNVEC